MLYAKETLQFGVSCCESSEPLPGTRQEVERFFHSTACLDHFLSAGGTKPCRHLDFDDTLRDLWNVACEQDAEIRLPQDGDTVIATTNSLQFPGMLMENTVYSGIPADSQKTTAKSNQMNFFLIAEEQTLVGARPVVWLYHKLTGGPPAAAGPHPPKAHARSKLVLTNNQTIVIEASVQITVEFPSTLLKLLPMSKEKVQEQGSASVSKTVVKDIAKSVETIGQAYQQWKESVAVTRS